MAKAKKQRPEAKPSVSQQIDRDLAASALQKRRLGQTPTRAELAALARVEKNREEEDRWRYYSSVPKRHYCELSGRQFKVLNEQAARYGAPFAGPVVDLSAALHFLHDQLAKMGRMERELAAASGGPALEKLRSEQARITELKRRILEKSQVDIALVHDVLAVTWSTLRNAGDLLKRQCGQDAHDIYSDAINEAEREATRIIESWQEQE